MALPIRPRVEKPVLRQNPTFIFHDDGHFHCAWDVLWRGEPLFIAHRFPAAYRLAEDLFQGVTTT